MTKILLEYPDNVSATRIIDDLHKISALSHAPNAPRVVVLPADPDELDPPENMLTQRLAERGVEHDETLALVRDGDVIGRGAHRFQASVGENAISELRPVPVDNT